MCRFMLRDKEVIYIKEDSCWSFRLRVVSLSGLNSHLTLLLQAPCLFFCLSIEDFWLCCWPVDVKGKDKRKNKQNIFMALILIIFYYSILFISDNI